MINHTEPLTFADNEDALEALAELKAPQIMDHILTKVQLLDMHTRLHYLGLEDAPQHETTLDMLDKVQELIDGGYNSLWN